MQHIKQHIQFKAGRLRNITIYGQKFKIIPIYERDDKCIRSFCKEYQYALPEEEGSIVFTTFNDIVKILTVCGESKSGLSTYYIKFCHDNNVFGHILDRIGKIDLNGSYFIDIIGFRKSLKKERHNHCEFLTWEYGKTTSTIGYISITQL